MRVLVCDDDQANRYLLAATLSNAGHTVTQASNGSEALKYALAEPPDLIVSDILMPEMDGYALAIQWRTHRQLADIPFVFYSANYTDPEDERFAQEIGVDRFLIKPMDPRKLLAELESIVAMQAPADTSRPKIDRNDPALLSHYNARLVQKLENKLSELRIINTTLASTTEELQATQLSLSNIIKVSPITIFTLDDSGHVTRWNPAAESTLGWKADDVIGKLCPLLKNTTGLEALIEKALKQSSVSNENLQVTSADNTSVVLSVSLARLSAGDPDSVLVMATDITAQTLAENTLAQTISKLEKAITGTVMAITKITEARDPYTAGHQARVAQIAEAIARKLNMSEDECSSLSLAGLIHDIGKIYVPAEILTKPRALTSVEFSIVKMHPEIASDILSSIDFPWPISTYVLQHHERLDGSGYPFGLSGDAIHLNSRILAVADVIEAMSSHRPYKAAAGLDSALKEIEDGAGVRYDPDVANAAITLFQDDGFANALPTPDSL